jgi:aspartate racemase
VVVPNALEREYINRVIFDQLCAARFEDDSRAGFLRIIERLIRDEGAEGVILGCTEIPLLIKQEHVRVPVFDTTAIHAAAAVDFALGGH